MSKLKSVTTLLTPAVCADAQRRTCLAVAERGGVVQYIPLSIEFGFNVEEMPVDEFSRLYQQLADYPPARCAALYVQYAMTVGASQAALDHLGLLVKLTEKEITMATAKKAAKAAKPEAAAEKPAKKVAAKKAAPAKKAVKTNGNGNATQRESAASMFKTLIMAGNFTDDTIFKKVQDKFGLDDSKRTYVVWYRKDLDKRGMKPPAAKGT